MANKKLVQRDHTMPRRSRDSRGPTPVESKAQLVEYLEAGCRRPEEFRLGLEQEKFVYRRAGYRPAAYDGPDPGIRELLESMVRFGWKLIHENGLPVALHKGSCRITLEPGGQLELSGAALRDVHGTFEETQAYHRQLTTVADECKTADCLEGVKSGCFDLDWVSRK